MASLAERKVLKILVAQLEHIPVRASYRPTLIVIVETLKEMSKHRSFELGRFENMADVIQTVNFFRKERSPKKKATFKSMRELEAKSPTKPRRLKRLTPKQILARDRRRKTMEEKARESG